MKNTGKSRLKTLIGGLALSALSVVGVQAAECPANFPGKAVNFWVGYGAGGGTDSISRALASVIEEQQGWTISVTNKPGAGSSVMMSQLSVASPDGLTIGMTSTSAATKAPYWNAESPYTEKDFDYIGTAQATTVGLAILTKAPYSNYEEMLAYAKEKGILTVSAASEEANVFFDEMNEKEGVNIVMVPTKGSAAAIQQLLGGHVDAAYQGSGHVQYIKAGTVKHILTFGGTPADFAPDEPTSEDKGYSFVGALNYVLIAAPKGVPADVKTCLEQVLDEAVNSDTFVKFQANNDKKPLNLGSQAITELLMTEAIHFKKFYEMQRANN